MSQTSFQRLSSDARFDLIIEKLRSMQPGTESDLAIIRNRAGYPVIRAERSATTLRLTVDLKAAPGLDDRLLALLPGIVADFSTD
jgi:hypothetical protein